MIAMIKISSETALAVQRHSNKEVYFLHTNGASSLIEDSEEILMAPDAQYGIEGEIFGKPYAEDICEHCNLNMADCFCLNTL